MPPQSQLSTKDFLCLLHMDMSATPNKSMGYFTQYLLSGCVNPLGTAGQLAMFQMKLATSVPSKVRKCACAELPEHLRSEISFLRTCNIPKLKVKYHQHFWAEAEHS